MTLHKIFDKETQVFTPLYLKPREAIRLAIRVKSLIPGTVDEKLLNESIAVILDRPDLRLPKHNYQLCFEDIDGNYFDQHGRLVNMREADLWWTLENSFQKIKENFDFRPLIAHVFKILLAKISFGFHLLLWHLGL